MRKSKRQMTTETVWPIWLKSSEFVTFINSNHSFLLILDNEVDFAEHWEDKLFVAVTQKQVLPFQSENIVTLFQ